MVDKEVLKQVIYNQREKLLSKAGFVKRDILDEILKDFDTDNRVIILTGVRRGGKSTLLRQIMEKKQDYCYVDFEDERFIDFKAQEFEQLNEVLIDVYGNHRIYFFDEIQNVDKFETFVRRLQDQGKKLIITGSNASLLSKELGTRLTGRYKLYEVYPFSFLEYLKFKNKIISEKDFYLSEKKAEIRKLFANYFLEGGFPEYLKNKDESYIRTIYENIIYRDVIARYSIRRQKVVKELVSILTTNLSSQFTYNSLKESLSLGNSITVKEYISYLSNAYLFFELQKFDFSIKKQINAPKKIYIVDSAFSRLIGLNFSENSGRILENIAFMHLKMQKSEIYYYPGKNECDFVVKEGTKITNAIQVCYNLNIGNKEREVNGLLEAMEEFKLKEGLILTNDQEDEFKVGKKIIRVMPVWKWLLS